MFGKDDETKDKRTFNLHLPLELIEKIEREARAEMRSRHAQIVYLLERHFQEKETENGQIQAARCEV